MSSAACALAWILAAAMAPPLPAPPSAPPSAPATPPVAVPAVPTTFDPPSDLPRVLVFCRTAGFRHKSIPVGAKTVRELGAGRFAVDITEDATAFRSDNLKRYKAVVFLSTTGDVLNAEQQRAFELFIRAGGGYAGVHAAADTEYDWPWYGSLVGAYFKGHPPVQQATVNVEDRDHPSTRGLPSKWVRTDEWYAFRTNPRAQTRVLASLDESSYKPGESAMGDHPIAWYREFEGGRSWYTALGHTEESFQEPLFRQHLQEGIGWAANVPSPAAPPSSPPAPTPPPADAPPANSASVPPHAAIMTASFTPMLAQLPTSFMLAALMVVLVVVLGALGQGIRAPLLGWLWPGLGHLSLGYRKRALLGMTGVVGMLVTGLLVGGADAVDSREDAAWFMAQAGNGPVAFGVDMVNQSLLKTGQVGDLMPAPPPAGPGGRPVEREIMISSYKGLGPANEFGTLFIALGGLMNLVLVMDCSRREPATNPAE